MVRGFAAEYERATNKVQDMKVEVVWVWFYLGMFFLE